MSNSEVGLLAFSVRIWGEYKKVNVASLEGVIARLIDHEHKRLMSLSEGSRESQDEDPWIDSRSKGEYQEQVESWAAAAHDDIARVARVCYPNGVRQNLVELQNASDLWLAQPLLLRLQGPPGLRFSLKTDSDLKKDYILSLLPEPPPEWLRVYDLDSAPLSQSFLGGLGGGKPRDYAPKGPRWPPFNEQDTNVEISRDSLKWKVDEMEPGEFKTCPAKVTLTTDELFGEVEVNWTVSVRGDRRVHRGQTAVQPAVGVIAWSD